MSQNLGKTSSPPKNFFGGWYAYDSKSVSVCNAKANRYPFEKYLFFLKQKISKCYAFSIALGKGTSVSDTAHLAFWLSH